jgi:surface antigen
MACAAALLALSGCAISTPLGPIFGSDEDSTTSFVARSDHRFTDDMSDADWTLAEGAVRSALDAGAGRPPAAWESRETGLKGTVSPVASAFATGGGLCQAFTAVVTEGAVTSYYQGRACRDRSNPWTITETSVWTPPEGRKSG